MGYISDKADITGSSIVGAEVDIMDQVKVFYSIISEKAKISGESYLYEVNVNGDAHVFGQAMLENNLLTSHDIIISDGCKFGGNATFTSLGTPEDFVAKYGEKFVTVSEDEVVLTNVWDMG